MRASLLALICVPWLAACGSGEFEDLKAFVNQSGAGLRGKVEPLPQVAPYEPFAYNGFDLPNPFAPRKKEAARTNGSGPQPDMDRKREALEAFPLESLKMVGTLERASHQERASTLKSRLKSAGLPVMDNPSHIVPVMVGDPVHCKSLTDALLDQHGIYVQPINYPTVAKGGERIRLTPSPQHTDAQMDMLVAALGGLWNACPVSKGIQLKRAAE